MKKLLLPLVAVAALAVPGSAFAWGHDGGNDPDHHGAKHGLFRLHEGKGGGTFVQLSGTGTSFGAASASITGTTFTATLASTWTSATTKTFGSATASCAAGTASVTITSPATPAVTYTGKTCSFTANGTTTYAFSGAASDGSRLFLKESGTAVTGGIVKGAGKGLHRGLFMRSTKGSMMGGCDH